jgi:hypothetical protein
MKRHTYLQVYGALEQDNCETPAKCDYVTDSLHVFVAYFTEWKYRQKNNRKNKLKGHKTRVPLYSIAD